MSKTNEGLAKVLREHRRCREQPQLGGGFAYECVCGEAVASNSHHVMSKHQAEKALEYLAAAQSVTVQLVTIKLPKNPDHNPREKLTSTCAVSPECTDSTGEHHTVAVYTDDEVDALRTRFGHITRIERVSLAATQPVVNSFTPAS